MRALTFEVDYTTSNITDSVEPAVFYLFWFWLCKCVRGNKKYKDRETKIEGERDREREREREREMREIKMYDDGKETK